MRARITCAVLTACLWVSPTASAQDDAAPAEAEVPDQGTDQGEGDSGEGSSEEAASPEEAAPADEEVVPEPGDGPAEVPETVVEAPEDETIEEGEEDLLDSFLRSVQLHGFGTYAAGVTSDNNQYIYGTPNGNFAHIDFALRQIAMVLPQLRISAGQWLHIAPFEETLEVELDFAFAEWSFDDNFAVRIGQSPMPVGLFAEVFDVGTLRPFLSLSQVGYGPNGLAIEQYRGLGATIRYQDDNGWELEVVPFAGLMEAHLHQPFFAYGPAPPPGTEESISSERETLGGGLSVKVRTPLSGLVFGVGGYGGALGGFNADQGANVVLNAHAAYRDHGLHIVVEYFFQRMDEDVTSHAVYGEVAYRFDFGLEIAGRGDWMTSSLANTINVSMAPSLLDHASVGLGVAYWFSPDFAVKLGYHFVSGNRLAWPDELREAVQMGELRTQTHYGEVGASFSF